MSCSRAALFLSFLAAPLVLVVSEGSSQSPTPAPAQAPLPPPSALIDVPVTKILPGNVDLTPKIKNPVADDAGAAQRGMKYFANFNCIGCHADNGGGGMGPPLMDEKWIYGSDPQQIFATIMEGRPNGMPSFRGKIPEDQVWQIVAYVRSLGGLTNSGAEPARADHMQNKPPENSLPAQTPTSANIPRDHP
jgi:cytochrome c oxidase cbb3-type subunit 3